MWAEDKSKSVNGYYIADDSTIVPVNDDDCKNTIANYNIFASKALAKRALAMARISQLMVNDERYGGVITDEEWNVPTTKCVIVRDGNYVRFDYAFWHYRFLAFHTVEQRNLFMQENEQLVKDYLMIK